MVLKPGRSRKPRQNSVRLSRRAMSKGLQTITRKGRTAAVVVGAEEWQRKTNRVGNLAEFFAASPLRGSGLKIRRLKDKPRKPTL